ncbi:MAG: flavodoxin domain-containing protein [Endomicrobium sp.]|jgi:flavorubredoxin|nr:flavodoxin domain-containing protein [Endomicrobium sp.]
MAARLIKENVYSVGCVDWGTRNFHGSTYRTNRGVTYNSYLILDEKVTLIDMVCKDFAKDFIENIKQITVLSKIEMIIINHIEPDHSGVFAEIIKLCPNAKVYGTEKSRQGLLKYYGVCGDFVTVKFGQNINIGKRTLEFIDVPMIHWPDSMLTYSSFDKILFSNDTFGQHYATNKIFDDEVDHSVLMEEAKKYYANILWPFGNLITIKLNAIKKLNLAIDMIAPSHGLVWRSHISKIWDDYLFWSANSTVNKVAIVYETMWNSTYEMAKKILEGITSEGVEAFLFDIMKCNKTDLAAYMLDAKGFVFGSSTHDNDMLPIIASFLHYFKGFKPKGRKAFAFGSYGWSGEGVKNIEEIFMQSGIEKTLDGIRAVYAPSDEELKKCYETGKEFALKIKG